MQSLRVIPITGVIAFCLFLVPFNIYLGNILVAKLFGVLSLVLVLFSLKYWFTVLRRKSNKPSVVRLNTNDIFLLNKNFPFITHWKESDRKSAFSRAGSVLAEVEMFKDGNPIERNEAIEISFVIGVYYFDCDFLPIGGKQISIPTDYFNIITEEIRKNKNNLSSVETTFNMLRNNSIIKEYFERI